MRERVLRMLRVSERPGPPPGAGALTTFRASRSFLRYSILTWFPKQAAAFFGLVFSLAFFGSFEQPYVQAYGYQWFVKFIDKIQISLVGFSIKASLFFHFLEIAAVATFVAQLLFTGAMIKLSWELRWYMVGDESLRIREGLWSVREQTMTIANIQNMVVRQGPLQRMFGISDLEVHTAGGGAKSDEDDDSDKEGLHIARFRGLDDAHALRDRLQAQLNRQRGAGLGHPDEAVHEPGAPESQDLLEAARALREAAKALRSSR